MFFVSIQRFGRSGLPGDDHIGANVDVLSHEQRANVNAGRAVDHLMVVVVAA